MVLSVPDKGIFEYVSGDAEYSTDRPLDIINEIRKECNSGKTHIVVNRCDEFRGNGFTRDNWFKFIATPVKLKDECRGVLIALSDPQEKDYTTCDLKLMTVLAGQLYARIIAVSDTYDSITSSRAYRMRNTHVSALKEIERVSGSQLDPEIVEIFKKVCEDHPDFIRGDL